MVKRFPSKYPHREVYPEQWANLGASEYAIPGLRPVQTDTVSLTGDEAVVWPWFNPIGLGINSANFVLVTGQGGATAKLALYEWDHENRALLDVIAESAAAFNVTSGEQGLVTEADVLGGYEPGWYAWALVSDTSSVAVRVVEGIDDMSQGLFKNATTTLTHNIHYTFDATGVIAGSFADDPTVTPVTDASNFLAQQAMVLDFALNPAFN